MKPIVRQLHLYTLILDSQKKRADSLQELARSINETFTVDVFSSLNSTNSLYMNAKNGGKQHHVLKIILHINKKSGVMQLNLWHVITCKITLLADTCQNFYSFRSSTKVPGGPSSVCSHISATLYFITYIIGGRDVTGL